MSVLINQKPQDQPKTVELVDPAKALAFKYLPKETWNGLRQYAEDTGVTLRTIPLLWVYELLASDICRLENPTRADLAESSYWNRQWSNAIEEILGNQTSVKFAIPQEIKNALGQSFGADPIVHEPTALDVVNERMDDLAARLERRLSELAERVSPPAEPQLPHFIQRRRPASDVFDFDEELSVVPRREAEISLRLDDLMDEPVTVEQPAPRQTATAPVAKVLTWVDAIPGGRWLANKLGQ